MITDRVLSCQGLFEIRLTTKHYICEFFWKTECRYSTINKF